MLNFFVFMKGELMWLMFVLVWSGYIFSADQNAEFPDVLGAKVTRSRGAPVGVGRQKAGISRPQPPLPGNAPVLPETPPVMNVPVLPETPVLLEAPPVMNVPVLPETPVLLEAPPVMNVPVLPGPSVLTQEPSAMIVKPIARNPVVVKKVPALGASCVTIHTPVAFPIERPVNCQSDLGYLSESDKRLFYSMLIEPENDVGYSLKELKKAIRVILCSIIPPAPEPTPPKISILRNGYTLLLKENLPKSTDEFLIVNQEDGILIIGMSQSRFNVVSKIIDRKIMRVMKQDALSQALLIAVFAFHSTHIDSLNRNAILSKGFSFTKGDGAFSFADLKRSCRIDLT